MKIREATRDDANIVGVLAEEFADYLRSLGDKTSFQFNARTYLRDGFGDKPAFKGFVAEIDEEIVGYLLYHFGYDTDLAIRILHVVDLYVRPPYRLRGAGVKRLFWSVYSPNRSALKFYERLGARYTKDLKFMYLPLEDGVG